MCCGRRGCGRWRWKDVASSSEVNGCAVGGVSKFLGVGGMLWM